MKTILKFLLISSILISSAKVYSQTKAVVEIDSVSVAMYDGISFPYWLKAGQTVKPGVYVTSISGLEFSIDSITNALVFSRVLKVTGLETVPAKKAWKLEALSLKENIFASSVPTSFISPAKFSTPGTYKWIVPPGVFSICVEVWGGGGNGTTYIGAIGGGGAGGGWGYECFTVTPGTVFSLQVGGAGGTSSFGGLISATGGQHGSSTGNVNGGSSSAKFNLSGYSSNGASGGNGANGGSGGAWPTVGSSCGADGLPPGGGGAAYVSGCASGLIRNSGAPGQVIIHW